MQRRSCIRLITTWAVAVATVAGVWSATAVAQSAAREQGTVLGVSNITTPAANDLLPYPQRREGVADPFINVRRYALVHVESGTLLASVNADERAPIASTTKLMTLHVVLRHAQLSDEVTIQTGAAAQVGSLMGMRSGEKYTVEQLLYGLMLVSGNDAAYALAGYVGGLLDPARTSETDRVARFVQEMNTRAATLGMVDTQFRDPAGLEDEGYSTARDMAKLAVSLHGQPIARQLSATGTISFTDAAGSNAHDLRNSNRLLSEAPYASGVVIGKTGFTPAAGHCLVTSSTRSGMTLVAVTLSSYVDTRTANAEETRKLLDWGFASYEVR
jgi:serine-type D-Ala-D-Ala carboxypeptidase (penicillin-binding protein 5/6)